MFAIVRTKVRDLAKSSEAPFALFVWFLVIIITYRVLLTVRLATNPIRPFDFNPASYPPWFMIAYFPSDLALALGFSLLSWILSRMGLWVKKQEAAAVLRISGMVFLHLFLISLLIIYGAHGRLLFDAQAGLDCSMIREAFLNVSLSDLLKFVEWQDALFLLLAIGVLWLVLLSPKRLIGKVSAGLIVVLLLVSAVEGNPGRNRVPAEIRMNPALFLLSDVLDHLFPKGPVAIQAIKRRLPRRAGLPRGENSFHGATGFDRFQTFEKGPPWNVVFIVMESVGTRYMFDTSQGNRMPMPFLNRLAGESWYLKRHYTSANISTKAIFSLLSGHYDLFTREAFGRRPDTVIPSIYNFLSGTHDSFLVTPTSLTWYFPTAFIKNSGLPEIHSYENLSFKIKEVFHTLGRYIARDEAQTVDFFIQRLDKAREPFLGIYVSFTAHLPYFDYGPEYQIMEEDGRAISRYYNNLNLLDHLIKRIYDHLEERGRLERTIFVVVGDHGQAFGQHHPDNYMHYRYSYNENLETPAIIYQPTLFKPRVIDFPTSHVDLLPTLLDGMNVPYDPSQFDGESLLQNRLRREQIFFYGYEGSISLLNTDQIKVQFSLKQNRCWAFNLRTDPDEENPLDCSSYQPQLETLFDWVSHHDSSLPEYNAIQKEKGSFQGEKHSGS